MFLFRYAEHLGVLGRVVRGLHLYFDDDDELSLPRERNRENSGGTKKKKLAFAHFHSAPARKN